ncbi:LysR family transcriptional regulator [Ureibacillus composti]
MNIEHIESFLYVVKYKSIHKAASALYLTQPTVSARIKALEESLETQLFIRQGRSLSLTERGKEFIPFATTIVDSFYESKKFLNRDLLLGDEHV